MDATFIALIAAGGGLAGMALTFASFWLKRGTAEALAVQKAESAGALAAAALANLKILEDKFNEHRVAVAREITGVEATAKTASATLVEAERRLTEAIKEMKDQFVQLGERLDRVFERPAGR